MHKGEQGGVRCVRGSRGGANDVSQGEGGAGWRRGVEGCARMTS